MENKSFYYTSNWDGAAIYQHALEAMGIPHSIESPGGNLSLSEGELALVFPDLPVRQFSAVRELLGPDWMPYPS